MREDGRIILSQRSIAKSLGFDIGDISRYQAALVRLGLLTRHGKSGRHLVHRLAMPPVPNQQRPPGAVYKRKAGRKAKG